uniref:Uncharacterized protein n=1 Tax=Glossina austeni TaxID=7395 RepID=A0A1A9VNN3_GLOAU
MACRTVPLLLRTIADQVSTNFDSIMAESASAICIGAAVVVNAQRKHLAYAHQRILRRNDDIVLKGIQEEHSKLFKLLLQVFNPLNCANAAIGMEIIAELNRITIGQIAYMGKLLEKFNMVDVTKWNTLPSSNLTHLDSLKTCVNVGVCGAATLTRLLALQEKHEAVQALGGIGIAGVSSPTSHSAVNSETNVRKGIANQGPLSTTEAASNLMEQRNQLSIRQPGINQPFMSAMNTVEPTAAIEFNHPNISASFNAIRKESINSSRLHQGTDQGAHHSLKGAGWLAKSISLDYPSLPL